MSVAWAEPEVRCTCMLATGYCGSGRSIGQGLVDQGRHLFKLHASLAVQAEGGANAEGSQELPTASHLRREFWHSFCGEIENEF